MKIDIFTLCYNEMDILPFVIDYWKGIARHVYVYDNGSTDGSIEYLNQYLWITVNHYESDGINDIIYLNIKNNVWKSSTADFVIVCDMDECILDDNLEGKLKYMQLNGQTISHTLFIETISETIPVYQKGKLYHELDEVYVIPGNINGKSLIFNPNAIKEINYEPGAHVCRPIGDVNYYDGQLSDPIKTIHIKNLSLDYKLSRHKMYKERLSNVNKQMGYGVHYSFSQLKQIEEFNDKLSKSKKYSDIF